MRVLASPRLTLLLLVTIAVAIAAATFVETSEGTATARATVYDAPWFEVVLGLFALNLVLALTRWWPFRPHLAGFALVHIAVIVILAGAAVTRFAGYEGTMFIREGESSDTIFTFEDHVRVSEGNQTLHFPVTLHRPGAADLTRGGVLGGQDLVVTVTEFWSRFGTEYADSPEGRPLVILGTPEGDDLVLAPGDRREFGGVRISHVPVRTVTGGIGGPGHLVVRHGTDWDHVALDGELPLSKRVGGVEVTVTEFDPDFGSRETRGGPFMANPMLRVRLTAADGTTAEQTIFAYRDDLSSRTSQMPGALAGVTLGYLFEPQVEISGVGDAPSVVANIGLRRIGLDGTEIRVPAGAAFAPVPGEEWVGPRGEFRVTVDHLLAKGALVPRQTDDPDANPAVRVTVTDPDGRSGEALVRKSLRGGVPVRVGDRTLTLGFGPVELRLPHSIRLDDFVLRTYPGSGNPVDFESHVTLIDPEKGIAGEPYRIYMNHPLSHRGFKHFQSSYDKDLAGTVLTVNFDPGKIPTYVGYGLITLGFLLVFLKKPVRAWSERHAADRNRGPAARGVASVLLLAGTVLFGASEAPAEPIRPLEIKGRYAGDLSAPPPNDVRLLPEADREAFGRLVIQDYQGRMLPVDTYSRALVRKTTKRFSHPGWEATDLVLSWIANPQYWWEQPLLSVRHEGLREMLGVEPGDTHVAPRSVFDASGRYRLADGVERAMRTSDRDRTKLQRKLLAFDERVNLVFLALTTRSLRVYPVPGDADNTWVGPTDIMEKLPLDDRVGYDETWRNMVVGLRDQDGASFGASVAGIAALQARHGAEVLPSRAALSAELFLNRWQPFSNLVWAYLVAALVLLGAFFAGLVRRGGEPYPIGHPGYAVGLVLLALVTLAHLAAYSMRWLASGRAPLANGFESLLFIALTVSATALVIEFRDRRGVVGGLGALLAFVVLGISMMSFFDPAIGLLVPVLNSYWLNIHVTVITASYGVLGLGALVGAMILVLYLFKAPGREPLRETIRKLDALLFEIVILGLGLLTIGTLLGGVWANESWGRYWGWDPKETWSLVTILVYIVVSHIKIIPRIRNPWLLAAGSFAGIASVVMTFFGVNYFLAGLHSYAGGEKMVVPAWVGIGTAVMVGLLVVSGWFAFRRNWSEVRGGSEGGDS